MPSAYVPVPVYDENDDVDSEIDGEETVGWSGILATLTASILQSAFFYGFFLYQRGQHKKKNEFSLYEPRQHVKKHHSPFSNHWIRDAWKVSQEDLLHTVGLDTLMYLRFLRLGARIAAVGVLFSLILIPLYATAKNRGASTTEFNQLTLARVEPGSTRLWVTVLVWWLFVIFTLYELWGEWKMFRSLRSRFMTHGDPNGNRETRYAVRVEGMDESIRSDSALKQKFEAIFPTQIRFANVFLEVGPLEKAVEERQLAIEMVERATALTIAKPHEPHPQTNIGSKLPCKAERVHTIEHFSYEIDLLNRYVDGMRQATLRERELVEEMDGEPDPQHYTPSSTGIVVFASLVAKESAMKRDYTQMKLIPAADPQAIIWENVTVPLKKQKEASFIASLVWTIGVLFWAVPVTLITAIANLGSILKTLGLREINRNTAVYGIVSGLLPVIALTILMIALYSAIVAVARKWIRFKSAPEVDAYTLYWHMLFQFANLWLILIGGSLFNELDTITEDPSSILNFISNALPRASPFFANMIMINGLGSFGLDLSMLPQYGTTLLMNLLRPKAHRTQRMIDEGKKPPEIEWGQSIPQHVFVFLVMIMYQPIVPLMNIFALVYFGGTYIVWKHQCLHVYSQSTEGGGYTTWQSVFGFLLVCLYTGEVVFIACMGMKEAAGQAACGFVPLAGTVFFHFNVHRTFIAFPSAGLDAADGTDQRFEELDSLIEVPMQEKAYWQPCLKASLDERQPMPYRREVSE